jgi:hypothetical protein
MTTSVLLDTSFLITLVDQNRLHHGIAARYYRLLIEQRVPMYFSAIVAAEFAIRQPISELPIKNFRCLPFNIPHSAESARLWKALGKRDDGDPRAVVRDDVKLLGQAVHESISHVLTEDASTLFRYCEKLNKSGVLSTTAIKLADGFDPSVFNQDGQRGFPLDEEGA